jgi:hypothetical protein
MKRIFKHLAVLLTMVLLATTCISITSLAAEKVKYPPKADIENKIFTQHMKGTFTGVVNGETKTFEDDEELPLCIMASDIVANYSEKTGQCSYTWDFEGVKVPVTISFSYDKKGNIVYTAPFVYTTEQFSFNGSMSGAIHNTQ